MLALRRHPRPDELGDLPGVRPDPARHRGHHRVRRPAHPGGARLAPRPRPGVGGARRAGRARCSASSGPSSTVAGVLFALLAGAAWAAYILLSAQTGRRWPGFDGLAMASVIATVLLVPLLARGRRHVGAAATTGSCCSAPLVGLLSSVIPYTCELVALRSLRPSVFSVLMSLEPAAAALAGLRRAARAAHPRPAAGHGVRRRRQHRRHPERRDHRRAGARLRTVRSSRRCHARVMPTRSRRV